MNVNTCHKAEQWNISLAIVDFDNEFGQSMSFLVPENSLTDNEKSRICYLSLPDSFLTLSDVQYHFRVQKDAEDGFLYGFVYFRQARNENINRGYLQQSVVLISPHPFFTLFRSVLRILAMKFFDEGIAVLVSAMKQIFLWEKPTLNHLNLRLFGLNFRIQNNCLETIDRPVIMNNIISIRSQLEHFLIPLSPFLNQLHLLWELVLLGQPILVIAPSADACSQLVQTLVNIILPLEYASDYRPYFTVHDAEFSKLADCAQEELPSSIIGVTNPYFEKSFAHWPHIIRIGDRNMGKWLSSYSQQTNTNNLESRRTCMIETMYKPCLGKVDYLLKRFKLSENFFELQEILLRRYLRELTQTFLVPLESYLSSLMPLKRTFCPLQRYKPQLKPFCERDFLKSIKNMGSYLSFEVKAEWNRLYKLFLRSPNFKHWYKRRFLDIQCALEIVHFECIADADIKSLLVEKSEVEIIDTLLMLKEKLNSAYERKLNIPTRTHERYKRQLSQICELLPNDITSILKEPLNQVP